MTRPITTKDKLAAIRDAGYRVSVSHKVDAAKKSALELRAVIAKMVKEMEERG